VELAQVDESILPPWLRTRLETWDIKFLTDIQVRALQAGIAFGQSMVVSAPTSSGKTLVGEIAALAALKGGTRVIYLVSHKALADQKYIDFLKRVGEQSSEPIASVALSTGDRTEGDLDSPILIATYEKALGLLHSGQLKPADALVVADELQILGETGRGAEIETLCAALRQRKLKQFVALTATVENPEDVAGWMNCKAVVSTQRDVPLHQEIWSEGKVFRVTFGQTEGAIAASLSGPHRGVLDVVTQLLSTQRGPVLVFTETRREASDLATAFGRQRPKMGDGVALAEQLELFSEPTESSEQLRENAERRVAFHNADLSPQERQVIESGFTESTFDVCFATSTLAAGVNFPFQTVVFSKLTFSYGDRAGFQLPRQDYRNMSGRAGRLGLHENGYSILLPGNHVELAHANKLVLPENDRIESKLISLSLRKTILVLVSSRVVANFLEIGEFFKNTLYWYQTLERNPKLLGDLERDSRNAVDWLIESGLVFEDGQTLFVTPLGRGTALSGLLPSTAIQFIEMLKLHGEQFEASFDDISEGVIYAACACDEFRAERPSRFMPYPARRLYEAFSFWRGKGLPVSLDQNDTRLAQCAQAVALFIQGWAERKIAFTTAVSSGQLHRFAQDVAWVLEGMHKIACVPELNCKQTTTNQISMLARRVRWGAPAEALDVMRVAERHNVPGLGRQRAMALLAQGISSIHDILNTAKDKLVELLRNDRRASALLKAASDIMGHSAGRLSIAHDQTAKRLGLSTLVENCNKALGKEYEAAIVALLEVETHWIVRVLDDGKRQNVPDILLQLADIEILLECKTCTKAPALIKKEEAWAVVQKSADFDPKMRRVSLGKPAFDETSKHKAAASRDITLVEHAVFMEALLRVHSGSLGPVEFLQWLGAPGVAELERLGGMPTFEAPSNLDKRD